MERWITSELKQRWYKLMGDSDKLKETFNYVKGSNPILSDISQNRVKLLILETMRRELENAIRETLNEEQILNKHMSK